MREGNLDFSHNQKNIRPYSANINPDFYKRQNILCCALHWPRTRRLRSGVVKFDKVSGVPYIEDLQEVIREQHGVEAHHLCSVAVTEKFQGKTVWSGVVEVFELIEHETASKVYAWTNEKEDPTNPSRHMTVLHLGLVNSPETAVRAAIIQEFIENAEAADP